MCLSLTSRFFFHLVIYQISLPDVNGNVCKHLFQQSTDCFPFFLNNIESLNATKAKIFMVNEMKIKSANQLSLYSHQACFILRLRLFFFFFFYYFFFFFISSLPSLKVFFTSLLSFPSTLHRFITLRITFCTNLHCYWEYLYISIQSFSNSLLSRFAVNQLEDNNISFISRASWSSCDEMRPNNALFSLKSHQWN